MYGSHSCALRRWREPRWLYLPVCLFSLESCWVAFPQNFFSSTIFLGSSTQTIEFSRFSFSSLSCPIFAATFCHVLRKEGKHKESKNGEWGRTWGDDKQSLADDPQAVCVTHKSLSHKKHTIAAKPSLKKSADAFSLSCSKKPTKDPFFFRSWWPFPTTAFTHFCWWRVLSPTIRSPWQNMRRDERRQETWE